MDVLLPIPNNLLYNKLSNSFTILGVKCISSKGLFTICQSAEHRVHGEPHSKSLPAQEERQN